MIFDDILWDIMDRNGVEEITGEFHFSYTPSKPYSQDITVFPKSKTAILYEPIINNEIENQVWYEDSFLDLILFASKVAVSECGPEGVLYEETHFSVNFNAKSRRTSVDILEMNDWFS